MRILKKEDDEIMRQPLSEAFKEKFKWNLLEMIWVYENRKMLPKSSASFKEFHSNFSSPLNLLESTLKQLKAEGLIDGMEVENERYMVLKITDDGIEKLISSGRLFRLKKHIILHFQ